MKIADIKNAASLRLYAYLLQSRQEDVELSSEQARTELGISSRMGFSRAHKELTELGIVSAERRPRGYVFRLLDQSEEPVEENILSLEQRAAKLDQMDASGNKADGYSPWGQRRKAQVKFLQETFESLFQEKASIDEAKAWLRATGDLTEPVLSMMQDIALRPKVSAPARYVLGALKNRDNPRPAPTPRPAPEPPKPAWLPKNVDFRTEEEAAEWRKAHPDQEFLALKAKYAKSLNKPRKPMWNLEDDE